MCDIVLVILMIFPSNIMNYTQELKQYMDDEDYKAVKETHKT